MTAYTCKSCTNNIFKGAGIIAERNSETTCKEEIECKACGFKWNVEYPISELVDSPIDQAGDFQIFYDIENWHDHDIHITFTSIEEEHGKGNKKQRQSSASC